MDWPSLILAFAAASAVVGGLIHRIMTNKGIGWQFIRFSAIASGLPIAGLLALNGAGDSQAITVIGAALGFAFGRSDGGNDT